VVWSAYDLRKTWNRAKNTTAPWWAKNSEGAYSSGLANLSTALAVTAHRVLLGGRVECEPVHLDDAVHTGTSSTESPLVAVIARIARLRAPRRP
jgi:hypothetical protein